MDIQLKNCLRHIKTSRLQYFYLFILASHSLKAVSSILYTPDGNVRLHYNLVNSRKISCRSLLLHSIRIHGLESVAYKSE